MCGIADKDLAWFRGSGSKSLHSQSYWITTAHQLSLHYVVFMKINWKNIYAIISFLEECEYRTTYGTLIISFKKQWLLEQSNVYHQKLI